MKSLELKRDVLVMVPYLIVLVALFALVGFGKITWTECIGGLVLLNVPAIFGLTKKTSTNTDATVFLICFAAAAVTTACASSMSEKEKSAAAESSHTAEHLKCVDDATTLEESRACRAKVREKWAAKDGGAR